MPPPRSPVPALIVVNPISGRGRGAGVGRAVAAGLERRGHPVELLLTERAGEAAERVATLDPSVGLIVSVGGDGTLREILNGLFQEGDARARSVPIGVVPTGTGNALGSDLGLPRDVDRALEMFEAGKTVEIDLAAVNGHLSFLVTGVGPDAAVVRDVDEHRQGVRMTRWRYLPPAFRAFLRHRLEPLTVEIDGERIPFPCAQVLASNLIHYGGLVRLCPDRILDDGRFEVFLFPFGGRLAIAAYVLRFFLEWLPGGAVEMRRARRVRVTSERPVPYHVDGDPIGETPVELEVTGERFQLLVP